MDAIDKFFDEYRFLSNFWRCDIKCPSTKLIFPSVENAYQAAKTDDYGIKKSLTICSSGKAKRIGKNIIIDYDSWEKRQLKLFYMELYYFWL